MDLNLLAACNAVSYGVVTRNILKELCRKGVNVALHPIGPLDCAKNEVSIIEGCLKSGASYNYDAPCLKIWHAKGLKEMIGRGEKIGFPIFELDRFTSYEWHQLRGLDKVFVTSEWAKRVVESSDIKNVHIVNLGVDRTIFNENIDVHANDIAKDNSTKFLICGKWEIRKGHDVVIDAFCKAFKPQDNVRLLVNCYNPFTNNTEWEKMYMLSEMASRIHIFQQRIPTQEGVAELMNSVDCGIFVSRAEGWNLELLEMMSCGKNVIATNATAHTEFANEYNAKLVDVGLPEDAFDGLFFNGEGQWPSLDERSIDQIVSHMRQIHEQKQSGTLQPNLSGIETAKRFSWENSAKQIIESIF